MSLFGTGRKEGVLAVLLLLTLALLQHAPGTMLGRPRGALDPALGAAGRVDAIDPWSEAATNQTVLLPAMRQAGEVLRNGSWPTWNPYARFGEPFQLSGAPLFYPPYWPLLLGDGARWLDWVLLFHTALACVLAYRMLRALSVSRYGAFVGAGLYGLGWYMTTALDRLPEAAAAAWLPWIVTTGWQSLFARRRVSHAAVQGLAIGAPFATGGIATATLGVGLALAIAIAGLLAIDREDRRAAATTTLASLGLAILFTAPLWLPGLEMWAAVAHSSETTVAHLQTAGLGAFLAPGLYGELAHAAPAALREMNPGADSLELAVYPGALALLVAAMGLLRPKRTRMALFWILVAGGALLLTLDGPASGLWNEVAPFFLRRPGATLAIFHLATVVLVALGLENFFDAPQARAYAAPIAATAALVASATAVVILFVSPQLGEAAVRGFVGPLEQPELAATLAHVRRAVLPPLITGSVLAAAFLAWRRLGILRFKRVLAAVALGELCVLALQQVPRPVEPTLAVAADMVPADAGRTIRLGEPGMAPAGWISGRSGIRAIDTDANQILDRTARYLELVEPGVVLMRNRAHVGPIDHPRSVDDPLLTNAGLGVVMATRVPGIGRFLPLSAAPGTGAADATTAQPYAALDNVPRLRVAFAAEAVDGPAEAESALRERSTLQHIDEIVVESPPPEFRCERPAAAPELEVVEDLPDRVRVRVDVGDGRGYLVLTDALAPGWRASVDGVPTPILPANLAFRAVPLREGEHEVVFDYRPTGLLAGMILAGLGLLTVLVMLCWRPR